jgi:[acyl-carrier-protein] S-malonyltransferase
MKIAFLFPGQGSQHVGMGKDLYEAFPAAKAVFDLAESATGLPIKRLCFEGPEDQLARTDVAQPAIFTHSAAVLACMYNLLDPVKVEAIKPALLAGLSLGEYSALYAADRISLRDALTLVTRRGAAMQAAATAVPSGMVSILGLDATKTTELCEKAAQGQVLGCANFNCPGQIVISGQIDACRRAEAMAKDAGASGAVALNVAGAFHSALMKPAADELGKALSAVSFHEPAARPQKDRSAPAQADDGQRFASPQAQVVSNVDAAPYACENCIRAGLLAQLTGAVRWQQSVELMLARGIERFYEIGPGRVLAGLMRRINRKAEVVSVNSREAVEKLSGQ